MYSLISVVNHHGEVPSRGHYSSTVKKAGQWYTCDDTDITRIAETEALAAAQSAYLLCFMRE
jgi:ubiquitin C-terminal hydrolase